MTTPNEIRLLIDEAATDKEANKILEDWAAQFAPKWISVEDAPPVHPEGETVRVLTDGYDDWYVSDFFEGEFYSRQDSDDDGNSIKITDHITHWMYLTKLP